MVKPASSISKFKLELSNAVAEYKAMVATDDKQAAATIEHFVSLIAQIPSSYEMVISSEENFFAVILKLWIYVDSIDTGYFNSPKKILIERVEKILRIPQYSLENLLKEYIHYASNFNLINAELDRVINQLENKEIEIIEIKSQKDEKERWMFATEHKYSEILKEQEENKLKLNDLQGQLDQKTVEITKYHQETIEKQQLIEKLKTDKKAKHLRQKELAKKIKELINKTKKPNRTVNFSNDAIGIIVQDKPPSCKELHTGLETLEKTLKELQQEKEDLSKKTQSLAVDIAKETAEKKILKDNLYKVEKIKEDLACNKSHLEEELEKLNKDSQVLKVELDTAQTNSKILEEKYVEAFNHKNLLETNYAKTQERLQEEVENKRILETKNEILLGENADKDRAITIAKQNIENLKSKLKYQASKFKEKFDNADRETKKELDLTRKSFYTKEQTLKQQIQMTEKQRENLESKLAIQEKEIKLLKENLHQVKTSYLEPLTAENETLKQELMMIKPQLNMMTQHNEELQSEITQLKLHLSETKKGLTELEIQNANLTKRLSMLKNISPLASPQKSNSGKFPFFNNKDDVSSDGQINGSPHLREHNL